MSDILRGKRVLELGSGPGFNLKVLQDLGAIVSGIETQRELIGGVPVNVRYGDAEHLDDVFGDEQFDIIYSRDLFSLAIMNQRKSGNTAIQTYRHTKDGGIGIHQITYEKLPTVLLLLSVWLDAREAGKNFEEMEEVFWGLPKHEREKMTYTNKCSLDPQDLTILGFRLIEYSIENGELNIAVKK